jgi:hypothetical protein
MSVSDIVSFPWEEGHKSHDTAMTNEDKRRLEMKAKQLEKRMNHERKG